MRVESSNENWRELLKLLNKAMLKGAYDITDAPKLAYWATHIEESSKQSKEN